MARPSRGTPNSSDMLRSSASIAAASFADIDSGSRSARSAKNGITAHGWTARPDRVAVSQARSSACPAVSRSRGSAARGIETATR